MDFNQNKITIEQYLEAKKLDSESENYSIELLSILLDISTDEVEELDFDEFEKLISQTNKIDVHNRPPKSKLHILGEDLYLIDNLYSITLGEFIDLENLFSQDYITNLSAILAILYRKRIIHNSPWILDEQEPYGDWIFHRAPLFNDVLIGDIYGIIQKYIAFRDELYRKYEGLFEPNEPEDEPEVIDTDNLARMEMAKEDEKQKNIKKWGWDAFVFKLAGHNPLQLEQTYKIPLLMAFNLAAMTKELGIEITK